MADGGTSDAGSGHRLPRAVGRWAPAGAERGLGARGRRQVCFHKDQSSTILISIHQHSWIRSPPALLLHPHLVFEVTFLFLQVVFIISAFIHEKKILKTPTKISAKNNTQKNIHHVPTANVPLPRGGPYPTVFPNIIEVFHCRRIRCLSFMINCLSFIVLYVFHSRE